MSTCACTKPHCPSYCSVTLVALPKPTSVCHTVRCVCLCVTWIQTYCVILCVGLLPDDGGQQLAAWRACAVCHPFWLCQDGSAGQVSRNVGTRIGWYLILNPCPTVTRPASPPASQSASCCKMQLTFSATYATWWRPPASWLWLCSAACLACSVDSVALEGAEAQPGCACVCETVTVYWGQYCFTKTRAFDVGMARATHSRLDAWLWLPSTRMPRLESSANTECCLIAGRPALFDSWAA